MASCSYTVPDLNASGDTLYGPRACPQEFINWAWEVHDFDKEDWDEGFGYEAACDITQPLARTFNAIWCLNYSAEDYMNESYDSDILHWGCRWARENIDELDARCANGSYSAKTHHGGLADAWTQLYLLFFYNTDVPGRAAVLVHESRHASGTEHDAGDNDSSWGYNGAWRWHALWLAWFAAAGARTTPALKTAARQRANAILDSRFTTHPGFSF